MNDLRILATNISGLGALQVVGSILNNIDYREKKIDLFVSKKSSKLLGVSKFVFNKKQVKTFLPNKIARVVELYLSFLFYSDKMNLIMGDLPYYKLKKQTVFVQNALIFKKYTPINYSLTSKVMKIIFKYNCKYVDLFIVQSSFLKDALVEEYGIDPFIIKVIRMPVPVINHEFDFCKNYNKKFNSSVSLIYPASNYKHKNHKMLIGYEKIISKDLLDRIILTVERSDFSCISDKYIDFIGKVPYSSILNYYANVDGLLFLSETESCGLPIIEAVHFNLPIICPDLPYTREILGDHPLYFKCGDLISLVSTIQKLRDLLNQNWKPDYTSVKKKYIFTWEYVSKKILKLACEGSL